MFAVNFRVQSLHGADFKDHLGSASSAWCIPFPQSMLLFPLLYVTAPFRSVHSSISPLETTLTFPFSFILLHCLTPSFSTLPAP